jgi:hypothetical protein
MVILVIFGKWRDDEEVGVKLGCYKVYPGFFSGNDIMIS